MQGHLLQAETHKYIGALLVLLECSEVSIKEFGANSIVTLVNKSGNEVIQTVLLHPSVKFLQLSFPPPIPTMLLVCCTSISVLTVLLS
jgi:hypothetical protein